MELVSERVSPLEVLLEPAVECEVVPPEDVPIEEPVAVAEDARVDDPPLELAEEPEQANRTELDHRTRHRRVRSVMRAPGRENVEKHTGGIDSDLVRDA